MILHLPDYQVSFWFSKLQMLCCLKQKTVRYVEVVITIFRFHSGKMRRRRGEGEKKWYI